MKKLMFLAVAVILGLGSCKKDEEVKPQLNNKVSLENMEKRDLGHWD